MRSCFGNPLARQYFTTAEEARFFEHAAKEVADGDIHPGLHAMALSKCEGDEVKANAMYLQLRVDVFKQEAAVGEKILEAAERKDKASLSKTGTDDWPVEVIIFVFLVVMAALLAMGFLKGYG